ncbi:hypothetical protein ACICHK_20560 [Streptomyces sp. AHU1]|uniref:hypothetical protein n=1 Tax=Streptomyces sp. AHU1 TaxID=3377215 RepID=UPI0038779EC4
MTAAQLITPTTPGGAAFASAFTTEAALRDLDLGPALKADIRTNTAGTVHVLSVHNATDEIQEFQPEGLLPQTDGPLLFLGGGSTTEERDGRLVARLAPHGFVQLGRILDSPQEHA